MQKPDKNSPFTLRLSDEADAKLKELAKKQRRSKTGVIEVLILQEAARTNPA